MRARVADHHPRTTFHTVSTASVSSDLHDGPDFGAFCPLLEHLCTILAPQFTRRAVFSRSFRISDAVGKYQPVEKPLRAPLRALFEGPAPRFCSVLAVFPERLDTIWSIDRSDSDFFNRLVPSTHSVNKGQTEGLRLLHPVPTILIALLPQHQRTSAVPY